MGKWEEHAIICSEVLTLTLDLLGQIL
jgi:hypothetical protein